MPVDIEENCLVVFDGIINGLEYPIYILRGNRVSVAYTNNQFAVAWHYDEQNDSIESKLDNQTGFAGQFITATGLLNHSGANMTESVVTKDMVIYKAVPTT